MEANLIALSAKWQDTEAYHKEIHDTFCDNVNKVMPLRAHRDYVESKTWGFGERSFWWLWKIICDELPKNPYLLEIGVFRGATLSVWRMLSKDAFIAGITPLNSNGGYWESNYDADIKTIHDDFGLHQPVIIQAYSNENIATEWAKDKEWDLIYLDGSHEYEDILFDLNTYSEMIKVGGYLVIDDCNSEMSMPHGYFQGHQQVTDAKLKWLSTGPPFEFICSVKHISLFKRV